MTKSFSHLEERHRSNAVTRETGVRRDAVFGSLRSLSRLLGDSLQFATWDEYRSNRLDQGLSDDDCE